MNLKNITRLAIISLAAGLIFDQLFWKHLPGISIPIFVFLYLAGLFYLTFTEGLRPSWKSTILIVPILFFAVFTVFRLEPFTLFVCFLLLIVCLLVLTMSWMGGQWLRYSLLDFISRFFSLVGGVLSLGSEKILSRKKSEKDQDPGMKISRGREVLSKIILPILGGLIIAVPALLILGSLLSSADPVFGNQMEGILKFIRQLNVWDLFLRVVIIVLVAYAISGLFIFSMIKSGEEKLLGLDKPVIPRFFNWISTITVIACVDLLFAFFVYVQFRYFFGGQANIVSSGYTYAEYARRGFNEMLMVAFLSLLLYLSLSSVSKRAEGVWRRVYTGLGVLLVLLVGVILVSAFQRLSLYEAAYGFSRIRTYSHVFMIWMGVLLAVTVYLEVSDRLRAFATVCLLVALGFGVTLVALNVDGFIARQNLARAAQGEDLDVPYLVSLSDDAMPDLYSVYVQSISGSPLKGQITGIFACRYRDALRSPAPDKWQSYNWSRASANTIFTKIEGDLPVSETKTYSSAPLIIDGQQVICELPRETFD